MCVLVTRLGIVCSVGTRMFGEPLISTPSPSNVGHAPSCRQTKLAIIARAASPFAMPLAEV